MILEIVCVGSLEVNCYILASRAGTQAIIIDPGEEPDKIWEALDKHKLKPGFVINTHGHYDHIGCDDEFNAPVYIHYEDLPLLKEPALNLSGLFASAYSVKAGINPVKDKEDIGLGEIRLRVIHTPGHTPGGVCLLMQSPQDKILFSGDTLFYHGIGRSDLPGGSEESLIKSIRDKLFVLPPDTIVYPGHGPSSTIGEEKANNPFLWYRKV